MLQTIARLLPASVLDAWEEIHLTYAAVVDASTLACTVVRIDDSTLRINPSYKVVRLLPDLRAGMYQRGRGTWFTMRFMLDQSGQHRVEFDYDTEPEFDFKLQAGRLHQRSRPVPAGRGLHPALAPGEADDQDRVSTGRCVAR